MTSQKSGFADSLEASVDRYVRNIDAVVMTVISQPGKKTKINFYGVRVGEAFDSHRTLFDVTLRGST